MEIIDKNGYLRAAFCYIKKKIGSLQEIKKIVEQTGIKENDIRRFVTGLRDFSERNFLSFLEEKLEESHSSLGGVNAEIESVNVGLDTRNRKPYIIIKIIAKILSDDEEEDRVELSFKIFSKNQIEML